MQKFFIILGVIFIIIGLMMPWILRSGIGHLPGDLMIKKNNFTFYFPLTTSIILSILLSIILWFLHK